jgi:hypothetical protein
MGRTKKGKTADATTVAARATDIKEPVVAAQEESASGLLEGFAQTAERVAATTKKLEKAALLGAYLRELDDADLSRAARYFAGHQFAMNDARTTNVGSSVLRDALSEATGIEVENLRPRYVRLGDAGEVAFEAVTEAGREHLQPLMTLAQTASLIERLSEMRGTKNKKALLADVLTRATPLEAKYLVKLLVGDLRIGLKEGLVEDSIARAFERELAQVAQANMLLGDIGETAVRARLGDLQNISMRLFHPLKFMLATAASDLSDIRRRLSGRRQVRRHTRAGAHVKGPRRALFAHDGRGDASLPGTRRAASKPERRCHPRRRDRPCARRVDTPVRGVAKAPGPQDGR